MNRKRDIVAKMLADKAIGSIRWAQFYIDEENGAAAAKHFSEAADSLRYAAKEIAKCKPAAKPTEAEAAK